MNGKLKVGDYARNVESGWLGKIVEIGEPQKVMIDDARFFEETTVKMIGVDTLVVDVAGVAWNDALADNDVQFHSIDDLRKA